MKTYSPTEMARLFNVHPNTIRLYERIGYIGKAVRRENNYREFTQKHIMQLHISRAVMAYPFTNHGIRSTGKAIINASSQEQIEEAKRFATLYITRIKTEIQLAYETELELKNWAYGKADRSISGLELSKSNDRCRERANGQLTRKTIAAWLDVTTESVRNWERNGLITPSGKTVNGEVYFIEADKKRLRLIYMLRQCGYSMSAIFRCMHLYDEGNKEDLVSALEGEGIQEILSAGDNWIKTLKEVYEAAMDIPQIIEQLEKLI